jgi:zinc transporter, ZIP family
LYGNVYSQAREVGVSHGTTVLFGAMTGATIFLGLPLARLRALSTAIQGILNALAAGILIFLLWDMLTQANVPVRQAIEQMHGGHSSNAPAVIALFLGGLTTGLIVPLWIGRQVLAGSRGAKLQGPGATVDAPPKTVTPAASLALMIAVGLGLHNFSEGLAIGQASAAGAIAFASVMVIGFGLHNVTEGLGIAAPLSSATQPPTWSFLGLMGVIAGGPTLLGTVIGYSTTSIYMFVLFLTLAAGALIYVITEILPLCRRLNSPAGLGVGLLLGFGGAYASDLFLTFLGA